MPLPQQPRFGEFLRRLFITKEWPSPQVLDDWFPSIDLLADRPEYRFLRAERSFFGGGVGLGAAASAGRVWLMNKTPAQLAIIEQIIVGTNTPGLQNFLLDLTTIGLPADGAGGQSVSEAQDARYGFGIPGSTPVSPVTVANDAAAGTQGVPLAYVMSSSIVIRCNIVLKTGYAAVVTSTAQGVGNNIAVSFWGYARSVEDNELK